jgi:DNA segregation ATPase FtsK/SpoIIIE-like protein
MYSVSVYRLSKKYSKILKSCQSVMVTLYSTSNTLNIANITTYNKLMFTE